ncbi:MAG TPA: ATP-binding protein [Gemmatimonadales bacterium]|nr:ATP-binding protein [Gemmatimonadales bacterium]
MSQSARAALEVTTPTGKRTILLTDHPVTLGRAEDCDVVIPEPFVSSCHAHIEAVKDGYVIRDAGSTNGTFVGSQHVEGRQRLEDGANLILGRPGNYRLRFISITTDAEDEARAHARKARSGRILKGLSLPHPRHFPHPVEPDEPEKGKVVPLQRAGDAPSQAKKPGTLVTNATTNRNLQEVLEISKALLSTLDLEEVLGRVLDACLRISHAERGYLFLQEAGDLRLRARRDDQQDPASDQQVEFSRSIAEKVAASGQAEFLSDLKGGMGRDSSESITRLQLQTIACVPLKIQQRVIGIVYLDSHQRAALPDRTGREVLEVLAGLAAVAIVNARMVEERVQNERWSTIGRMAASIVHDIRSPMAALRGTAELLRMKLSEPTHVEKLNLIIQEVDRLTKLSGEMLEFSAGAQPLRLEELSLSLVVEQFLKTVEPRLEKEKIELECKLDPGRPLPLDRHKLARLLHNVVGNALEAMQPGGKLKLETRGVKDGGILAISDSGAGMDEETLRRVCEPFFSQGKVQGIGLGMAIVRRIAEQHGATLSIESHPGKGTRVELHFPTRVPERGQL